MNVANNNQLTSGDPMVEAVKCFAVLVWGLFFVGSGFWALLAPTWQDPAFALFANWAELVTAGATLVGMAKGWLRFPLGSNIDERVFALVLAVALLLDAVWNLCRLGNFFH